MRWKIKTVNKYIYNGWCYVAGIFPMNSPHSFFSSFVSVEHRFAAGPTLTMRNIGGILDFYFILGNSAEDVTQKYTGVGNFTFLWSVLTVKYSG